MNFRDKILSLSEGTRAFLELGPLPREDGYSYYDLPLLTPEQLEEFLTIVGADQIEWLSFNTRTNRGQMFISQKGKQLLNTYLSGITQ